MLNEISTMLCNGTNFRSGNRGLDDIRYIVIHYTANDGDTAKGNCSYFSRCGNLQASAHYFVDENEIWQSVLDKDIAWHCGANAYIHPFCRNQNSLGIELCSRKDAAGKYYFKDEVVRRGAALTRALMDKYSIQAENVVRHFDVTGKICPAPFVADGDGWQNYKMRLEEDEMTQEKFDELMENYLFALGAKEPSEWSEQARTWAEAKGIILGDENGDRHYKSFCTREQMAQMLFRIENPGA